MAEPALSPSRAKDFMQCPLLFRLRTVDCLPEAPSVAAIRGTCIHAALEHLYDVPATEREQHLAHRLFDTEWQRWRDEHPDDFNSLGLDEAATAEFSVQAHQLLDNYFTLENPLRLEPAARERFIEAITPQGLRLRGIIDRVDVAPAGTRIVDYKSGKSPHPRFVNGALFQMRFYALMYRLVEGVIPRRLQLLYLRDKKSLTLDPTVADLHGINE